jgi:hypothetical protein
MRQVPENAGIEKRVKRLSGSSPAFQAALTVAVALTLCSGVAHILMAACWEHPTALQQSSFDAMETAWKIGFGAIIGLIGAKRV